MALCPPTSAQKNMGRRHLLSLENTSRGCDDNPGRMGQLKKIAGPFIIFQDDTTDTNHKEYEEDEAGEQKRRGRNVGCSTQCTSGPWQSYPHMAQ